MDSYGLVDESSDINRNGDGQNHDAVVDAREDDDAEMGETEHSVVATY